MSKHKFRNIRVPIDKDNVSIWRDESLCIKCGACKSVCKYNVCVYDYYDLDKTNDRAICINCGQCSLVCPVRSIREVNDVPKLKKAISGDKIVIFQTSPAVRVSLGEEFNMEPGTNVEGKMVRALRELGATYVFDTTFGADMTVMEEASELLERLESKKNLPMFTSCCPAWVKYVETFYPEFISNLSTVKSPISIEGSLIKNYFAKMNNIDINNIISIAVTPCTAKKYEIKRREFNNDIDYVITTRELANWIREANIDFNGLKDSSYDDIMSRGSGAGLIFGNSGGVMEASLRTAYHLLTGNNPKGKLLNFEEIRGLSNIKETSVDIGDMSLKVAIINGTGDAKKVLEKIKSGEHYDFIEVMACEGGCVAGGGQPINHDKNIGEVKKERIKALYETDINNKIRNSYENKDVVRVYREFLGEPLSKKAHKILHTTYINRGDDLERKEGK